MSDAPSRLRGVLKGRLIVAAALVFFVAAALIVVTRAHRPTPVDSSLGTLVFEDTFDRDAVGDAYRQSAPDRGYAAGTWRIEDGRLLGKDIHNAGLWMRQPLPDNVRIEFDARAHTGVGDVKVEVFGDGQTHQSGYIVIHGGWHNSVNAIARQDEHGEDRKEDRRCAFVGSPQRRSTRCVEPNVDYHWAIERTDHVVRWSLDGALFLTFKDGDPLKGQHFGFNNWKALTSFDNLKIYDLGP